MMTQAQLEDIENEANEIFTDRLAEFDEMWNTRPMTAPPYVPDAATQQLLLEEVQNAQQQPG